MKVVVDVRNDWGKRGGFDRLGRLVRVEEKER